MYTPTPPPNPQYQPPTPAAAYNVQPPPVPAYVPATTTPTLQQQPAYNNYQNRYGGPKSRGGRGQGGRGRGGRGGRGNIPIQQSYPQVTAVQGTIPPPPGYVQNQTTQRQPNGPYSNTVKHFNNFNMCCNCGYDVPSWHTSATCPVKAHYPQHNDAINRNNADQYRAAGWKVSKKAMHKVTLPPNPGPNQA